MHHQQLFLFGKAVCVFSRAVTARLVMFLLLITIASINALSQSSATSTPQITQDSKTPASSIARNKSGGGFLGVYLGDINEQRAQDLKLAGARGAVVGKVEEGSPAAKAGLLENDVILSFNDQQIYNPAQLYKLLSSSSPGSAVGLGISREGRLQSLTVNLGQRRASQRDDQQRLFADADADLEAAEDRARQAEEARKRGDEKEAARLLEEEKVFRRSSEDRRAWVEKELREGKIQLSSNSRRLGSSITAARYQLGVRVMPLNEQLAKFFNVEHGVLVDEVRAGGAAENAGIKAGDCIIAVNGELVNSLTDLNRLVDRTGKDEKDSGNVMLSVVRDREQKTIKVEFGPR